LVLPHAPSLLSHWPPDPTCRRFPFLLPSSARPPPLFSSPPARPLGRCPWPRSAAPRALFPCAAPSPSCTLASSPAWILLEACPRLDWDEPQRPREKRELRCTADPHAKAAPPFFLAAAVPRALPQPPLHPQPPPSPCSAPQGPSPRAPASPHRRASPRARLRGSATISSHGELSLSPFLV
jgi:hypothetical protein